MSKKEVSKVTPASQILNDLRAKFNIPLKTDKVMEKKFYATGSSAVDYMLHGGWGVGKTVEILGDEHSGKTALCIVSAISMIKNYDRSVLFFDLEQSLDPSWYNALGGNYEGDTKSNKLFVVDNMSSIESAEEIYNFINEAVATGLFGLVIIDSMDTMQTADTIDKIRGKSDGQMNIDARIRDTKPKLNSVFFRRIPRLLSPNECTLLITNQYRATMATMPGAKTKIGGGGRALPYYAQQRIDLYKYTKPCITANDIDKNKIKEAYAYEINVRVMKNKYGSPFGNEPVATRFWVKQVNIADSKSQFYGFHEPGFDNLHGVIQAGKIEGLITRSGSWYNYKSLDGTEVKEQGEGRLAIKLKELGLVDEVITRAIELSVGLRGDPVDHEKTGFAAGL